MIALEEGMVEGQFTNAEVWIFTDKSMAESVFFKGHSSNPCLNELALRLHLLEMNGKVGTHCWSLYDRPSDKWTFPRGLY